MRVPACRERACRVEEDAAPEPARLLNPARRFVEPRFQTPPFPVNKMDQLLRPTRHLLHVARACSPRTQVPTCRRLVSTARCSPQPVPRSLQLHASWPSARHIPIANLASRAFATRPPTPSSPTSTASSSPPPSPPPSSPAPTPDPATSQITAAAATKERHENIYTIPNALTVARIIACPAIGYYILKGDLATATGLLFVAGVSDLVRRELSHLPDMKLTRLARRLG